MKKTSVFQNSLIWFGAGVSIAEILTGTYFAPLGMAKGFAAILIGHILNGTPLEASTRRAMDGVYTLIDHNKDNEDKNRGIPVEQFLSLL